MHTKAGYVGRVLNPPLHAHPYHEYRCRGDGLSRFNVYPVAGSVVQIVGEAGCLPMSLLPLSFHAGCTDDRRAQANNGLPNRSSIGTVPTT